MSTAISLSRPYLTAAKIILSIAPLTSLLTGYASSLNVPAAAETGFEGKKKEERNEENKKGFFSKMKDAVEDMKDAVEDWLDED